MYTRLLIPVDGSEPSDHAAHIALTLAKDLGASVVFANVTDAPTERAQSELPNTRSVGESLLKTWCDYARAKELAAKSILKEQTGIAETLLETAKEEQCDAIVLGTHGRTGLPRLLLGSVAERVARMAHIPVLLVRSDDMKPKTFNTVLFATDGSRHSYLAHRHADALTQKFGAKLVILNVAVEVSQMPLELGRAWMYTDTAQIRKQMDDYIAKLKAKGQSVLENTMSRTENKNITLLLREGRHQLTSEVIRDVAKEVNADIIVVGTQGHTGLRKFFLGSVANEVAHNAKQPVLLVRDGSTSDINKGEAHVSEMTSSTLSKVPHNSRTGKSLEKRLGQR
jgi:nucleotide-binding universal stress UspA family protein